MDFQEESKLRARFQAGLSDLKETASLKSHQTEHDFTQGVAPSMSRSNTLPPPPDWAIKEALSLPDVHVSWLAGDGSDRCYYRIKSSASFQTFVLMQLSGNDAQELKQDGYEWVKIGKLLHDHGIYAPQTIATLPDFAALIIEDYGDVMLETFALKALRDGKRDLVIDIYKRSFEVLAGLLEITESGNSHWKDRSFDLQRFDWELHFFREQFVEGVLNWTFSAQEKLAFAADASALALYLSSNSKYFVHRDFHSRNVMLKEQDLAIIDFQDARLGPATYDLVSLCFDSYIPLTESERIDLLNLGLGVLRRQLPNLSTQELEDGWRPMLLQRQLKALGSFSFLTNKKFRGNYLAYVSPALQTLSTKIIGDSRWNFISGPMLEQVQRLWKAKGM